LNKIWGYEFAGDSHTVNSHINRLRRKIEPDPDQPTFILTTWGVGYRFTEDW
ncbi:MAG: helix-turn-helix domain-containing protein, partial [Bacteroidota bacterium]